MSFDPELYLRLLGEDMLSGGRRDQALPSGPLIEAAGALVAVGVITAARSGAILGDYLEAAALREHGGYHHAVMVSRLMRPAKARSLGGRRVVPLDVVLPQPHGRLRLRYAVLSRRETSLAFVYQADADDRRTRGTRGRMMMGFRPGPRGLPWGAPAPTLVDDRGHSAQVNFSGGGNDREWDGRLTTHDPLSPRTAWLELDGHRIALGAQPVPSDTAVEPVEEPDPARRFLWHRLGVQDRHGMGEGVEPAIAALVAAGALSAGDPVIAEVRTVADRMPHRVGAGAPTGSVRGLPEPWRSLLGRARKQNGPVGGLVVGATTPLFGGHRVGLLSLDSQAEGFMAHVEVSPWVASRPFGALAGEQLAWWAADDRGNHYLGSMGSSSGGGDHGSGELHFWPALDPAARRLELRPTSLTARAVIGFPLTWSSRTGAEPGAGT